MKTPPKVRAYLSQYDEVSYICRVSSISLVQVVSHRIFDVFVVNWISFFVNWVFDFRVESLSYLFLLNFFPLVWLTIIIYIWQNTYYVAITNQNRNGGKLVKISLGIDARKTTISSGRASMKNYQTFFLKWIWKPLTGEDLIYLNVKVEDDIGITTPLVPRDLDKYTEKAFANMPSSDNSVVSEIRAINSAKENGYITFEEARESIKGLLGLE